MTDLPGTALEPGRVVPGAALEDATLWHLATMCRECGVSTWE